MYPDRFTINELHYPSVRNGNIVHRFVSITESAVPNLAKVQRPNYNTNLKQASSIGLEPDPLQNASCRQIFPQARQYCEPPSNMSQVARPADPARQSESSTTVREPDRLVPTDDAC